MKMKKMTLLSILLIAISLFGVIPPDKFNPETDVKTNYFFKNKAKEGDEFKMFLELKIPEGYHITHGDYFYIDTSDLEGKYNFKTPKFHKKEAYKDFFIFKNDVVIELTGKALAGADEANDKLLLGYQICSETGNESCYMPVEKEIGIDFKVVDPAKAAKLEKLFTESQAPVKKELKKLDKEAQKDLSFEEKIFDKLGTSEGATAEEQRAHHQALKWSLWILLGAFLGGILDSLTPCVYPIIPVVISYMGARSGDKKSAGFFLSLFFVLGLAITYSIVGLGASFLGGTFGMGSLASNPWVLGFVATVFLVLSLSMFGLYDIKLISAETQTKWMSRDFTGPLGAILLGMISGVVAAPCVGPVLATLLVHATLVGDMLYGWVLFFVFAMGLGLLFLVIGTFAGALNALPQAGAWMVKIKKFFGVLMVAAAIYFIHILIPEWILHSILAFLLTMLAIFVGAFRKIEDEDGFAAYLGKTMGLIAFVVAILFVLLSFDHFVKLPFGGGATVISQSVEKAHVPFYKTKTDLNAVEDALIKAKRENKLVLVDFWAEWCPNCKALDKTVWNKKSVINAAEKFIPIKIDFTNRNSDFSKKYMEKFQSEGATNPPLILVLDANGNVKGKLVGLHEEERVANFLKDAVKNNLK